MVRLKCEVVSRSVWMEVVAISPVAELIEKCPKTSPPRTLGNKYLFVCLLVCLLASLFVCLFVVVFVCLFVSLCCLLVLVCLFVCLLVSLFVSLCVKCVFRWRHK